MTTTLLERMLVDGLNRPAWLAARGGRIGGSDAAKYAKLASAPIYAKNKLDDSWSGNTYTVHGNDRERAILAQFGLTQNLALFHAEGNVRHVCTPDAYVIQSPDAGGGIVLAQVKTSNKPIVKISPAYLRQMWWEQYVMGAERTLFIWEQHSGFSPIAMEAESQIVERNDAAIDDLITIADAVLEILDETQQFYTEMRNH